MAQVGRAFSNQNILDAKFETAEFTGAWLDSFGRPELCGAWIIYGESGSGKTHLALALLKYLSRFRDRLAYDTLEQGLSASFQNAWRDANMEDVGSKVVVWAKAPILEVKTRLRQRKAPDIIVIDSITALVGFNRATFIELINQFPDKLFIFLAHEENNKPYPAIAQHVRKLSEIKIRVEGFKGFVTTRFQGKNGEGGANFTIWEEGANEYWVNRI